MKTNEVEKKLGLTKHSILYYEKEGFIKPERNKNGYRNYNYNDLQTLKLVKFLRGMNISIDDTKAILNNKLSFNDCLKIRKLSIDHALNELESIQQTVTTLKEMHVPLIPALENIKFTANKKGLGYRKTTATVAYNRPLTRAMAIRQILSAAIIASVFTAVIIIGFLCSNNQNSINYFFITFIFIIITFIFTALNFQFMMHIYDKSRNQSIEFLEDGIKIYKRKNYWHHFKYIMTALLNKHQKYQNFYSYQEIDKLVIHCKHRYTPLYMAGGFGLSTDMYEVDIKFYFNDGETFFLLGPGTYNNDSQYIGHILAKKIAHIDDSDNILIAYQNKINLTDYMMAQKLAIQKD